MSSQTESNRNASGPILTLLWQFFQSIKELVGIYCLIFIVSVYITMMKKIPLRGIFM